MKWNDFASNYTYGDWVAIIILVLGFYAFVILSLKKAFIESDDTRRHIWATLIVAVVFPFHSWAKSDDLKELQTRVMMLEKRIKFQDDRVQVLEKNQKAEKQK